MRLFPSGAAALSLALLGGAWPRGSAAHAGADATAAPVLRSRAARAHPAPTPARAPAAVPDPAELLAELGCAGCHAGVPAANRVPARAPDLRRSGLLQKPALLLAYLRAPTPIRHDIGRSRMPDFRLGEPEALALTLYLTGGDDAGLEAARRRASAADAALGRRIFVALNCGACHAGPAAPPWRNGPDLSGEAARVRPEWLRAYLRRPAPIRPFGAYPGSGGRMPDFRLTAEETDVLADYLGGPADHTPGAGAAARPGAAADRLTAGAPAAAVGGPVRASGGDPARPLTAFDAAKLRALLETRLPCLGCHALDGAGGRIGPELRGVAGRLRPAFVRTMLEDPQRAAPGTIMPRVAMDAATRELLVRFLLAPGPTPPPAAYLDLASTPIRFPRPRSTQRGAYDAFCAPCHGTFGRGDGYNARFLPVRPAVHASADSMAARPDDVLFDAIAAGAFTLGRSARMPGFGATLAPAEVRGLVGYIRALCRCQGPAWSRDGERAGKGGRP
ncbi:MAG TPA: c-type cytochrome [Longimicrobiales bacterium]|nr:c-type cytochrome [Longimicrobiales bacterium]